MPASLTSTEGSIDVEKIHDPYVRLCINGETCGNRPGDSRVSLVAGGGYAMRVLAAAAAAAFIVSGTAAASQFGTVQDPRGCGGENPERLLVTVEGFLITDLREGTVDFRPLPFDSQRLVKICDIRSLRDKGDGKSLLVQWSDPDNNSDVLAQWVVKEGLSEICAALETCRDVTKRGREQ